MIYAFFEIQHTFENIEHDKEHLKVGITQIFLFFFWFFKTMLKQKCSNSWLNTVKYYVWYSIDFQNWVGKVQNSYYNDTYEDISKNTETLNKHKHFFVISWKT